MNIVQNTEGLGAAWLMATVGQRNKKLSKKDITSVSIPQACRSVEKQLSLRLASNLMYGLTLIHRQQVHYVFEDITTVHSKLTRPLHFEFHGEEKTVQTRQRKHVPLPDSDAFTMRDFACDDWFPERMAFRDLDECLENYMSHAQRADALDKSLDEILEKTMATIRANETTFGEPGFEFDVNGGINSQLPVLDEINFDEDFALEPVADEISKSLRDHTSRDPHFSTTSNPLRSTLDHRTTRQKRKHVKVDPVNTHSAYSFCYPLYLREFETEHCPSTIPKRKKYSLWDAVSELSYTSPAMLNYARQLLLQPPSGTIPRSRLPSAFRRARDDEVEVGRNIQVSADAIEFARRRASMLDFEEEGAFDTFDLDEIELGSEDASFQFPSSQLESQGSVGRNLHKLALKLLGYIQKRSLQYGIFCDYEGNETSSQQYRKISFMELFPVQPLGESDMPVTRKLAAKSFGTVLELATKKAIYVLQGEEPTAEAAIIVHSYEDRQYHNVLDNIT
ncbi:hypothetical protein FT663_03615 [Candidozyma haemuli var. vulneris]|uniref:Rad21/Rec8-like protein N-terminal domain-containing protein n=1 Tax=Candidozyma haemuli TaxID=45357 RepID=A0A2V1AX88_9ASCO|nr:hypothetical protein CXQ85_005047 [[Candida] haemuloni]KAF3989168.1 hypothetical protein FT662_02984 [[Candida] haemuloni var. vulneris]KAF3989418.1 hypothetical protein FT663_03615 [[Candida] haemuloni var. vulneris]PVH22478.1 hypothetical protein CXQ85_005047 [[Candida] haemuloni]